MVYIRLVIFMCREENDRVIVMMMIDDGDTMVKLCRSTRQLIPCMMVPFLAVAMSQCCCRAGGWRLGIYISISIDIESVNIYII